MLRCAFADPSFDQDCIPADHHLNFKTVFDNCMQGQGTADLEFGFFTRDHELVEILLNATPRTDACGRIVGMLGVGQDITERKQVEKEKMLLAQELQAFVGTANAPIFGIDAKGLVNEWNNKSAGITGFTREEVLGTNFVQVRPV